MAIEKRTPGLKFEDEVRGSLNRIGFKDVGGGPTFRVGEYQVDACAGWDDVLIVIECTQTASDDAYIRGKILEFRGKAPALKKAFRQTEGYEAYSRFVFAIITKNITFTEGDKAISGERPTINLITYEELGYYQHLASLIGKGALFNLLGELGVQPKDLTLPKVPAFRVRMGKVGNTFLFWSDPRTLLEIAYVARRELGQGYYYQRLLDNKRLQRIGRFIDKDGVFPNNIIICFDEDKRPEFRRKPGYDIGWPEWLEVGELIFPKSYRSAWVIDGQHRLYAFRGREQNPKIQKLAVFAFERLPLHIQAKFFIDINHEQKPVSQDLIWDLRGDLDPENSEDWAISNCVKLLNSIPPLENRVSLPLSGKFKRGLLKMSGLCQDLKAYGLLSNQTRYAPKIQKNPLTQGQNPNSAPKKVSNALACFLKIVKDNSGEAIWDIILRPGGITLALGIYEQVLVRLGREPTPDDLNTYVTAFIAALLDIAPNEKALKQLKRGSTSYAQRRDTLREVISRMQVGLNDTDFGQPLLKGTQKLEDRIIKFERQLAEFVSNILGINNDLEPLKQKSPEGVWRTIERIVERERAKYPDFSVREALSLGDLRQIMDRHDNQVLLKPHLTRPSEGFNSYQEALEALTHIIEARKRFHGRQRGTIRLVETYVDIFERCFSS